MIKPFLYFGIGEAIIAAIVNAVSYIGSALGIGGGTAAAGGAAGGAAAAGGTVGGGLVAAETFAGLGVLTEGVSAPAALGATGVAGAGTAAGGSGLLNAAIEMALYTGLSYGISALTSKSASGNKMAGGGLSMNTSLVTDAIKVVYGKAGRIGASQVFVHTTKEPLNRWLHVVCVWCEGPVEGIETDGMGDKIWVNKQRIQEYTQALTGNPIVWWYTHTGHMNQGVDPYLAAYFSEWSDALRGTCYTYFKCKFSDEWQSFPEFSCVMKGRLLFDPRDGSIGYSANPALAWLDFKTHPRYGGGILGSLVNKQSVIDAANTCASLGFEFNGCISERQDFMTNITDMLLNFRAEEIWSGGEYKLFIREFSTAVMNLDERDVEKDENGTMSIGIQTSGIQEYPQRVKVVFNDKDQDYNPTYCFWPEATPYTSLIDTLSDRQWSEVPLIGINDFTMALKMAKYLFLKSTKYRQYSIPSKIRVMSCELGDIVNFSRNSAYPFSSIPEGWSSKPLRLGTLMFSQDNKLVASLEEESSDIYDTTVDVSTHTNYLVTLPDATDAPDPPTNLSATTGEYTKDKGASLAWIKFQWDNVGFGTHYELEYRMEDKDNYTRKVVRNPGGIISDPLFVGNGTLTMKATGNYTGASSGQMVIELQTATTFRWSIDGGSTWQETGKDTAVGTWISLVGTTWGPNQDTGIDIMFEGSGGLAGDYWTMTASPSTPVTITLYDLPTGKLYYWKVKSVINTALNIESVWVAAPSPIVSWSPNAGPSMEGVTLYATSAGTVVFLNWEVDYVDEDLFSWQIWRAGSNSTAAAVLIDTKSAATRSYRDTNVSAQAEYWYWLKGVNRAGVVSTDFTTGDGVANHVLFKHLETMFRFDTIPDSSFPDEDGYIGYAVGAIVLDDCEAITGWSTNCSVDGAVTFTKETGKVAIGNASVRVDLTNYPKAETMYEAGASSWMLGYDAVHEYAGQSFKLASSISLKAIEIRAMYGGGGGGGTRPDITVDIYSDSSGKPGTKLTSGNSATILTTSVDSTMKWRRAIFTSTVSLTSGTKYWLILYCPTNSKYYYIGGHFSRTNQWGDADEYFGYGSNFTTGWYNKATYDMNFKVEVWADLQNKYIYKNISSADISLKTYFKNYLYSSRSGSFMSQFFSETGPPPSFTAPDPQLNAVTIVGANQWELKAWNISAITGTSRNAVIYIGIKLTEATLAADTTIYMDHYFANVNWPLLQIRRGTSGEGGLKEIILTDQLIGSYLPSSIFQNPETQYEFYEDFTSIVQDSLNGRLVVLCENAWESAFDAITPTYTAVPSSQDRGGVIQMKGDSPSGSDKPCMRPYGANTSLPHVSSKDPVIEIKEAQYGTTASITRYMGLGSANLTAAPADGIYIRHTTDGAYTAVTRKTSTESTLDLGVSAANGTFHILKLVVTGTTSVEAFIDGVSKGNVPTAANIPTANLFFSMGTDNTSNTNGMYVDYVRIRQDR